MNGSGPSPRAGPSRSDGEYDERRERDDRENDYGRPGEVSTFPIISRYINHGKRADVFTLPSSAIFVIIYLPNLPL